MNINEMENKLFQYVSDIMLPKMPNGINKFLAYVALGTMRNNLNESLNIYVEMGRKLGIINNNEADIDKLEQALQYAFTKVPTVDIWGFVFTKNDLVPFIEYLRG